MIKLPRFIPLTFAAGAILVSGCDTLRARAIAQDGVDQYRNGDIKKAADLFEEATKIDPTVPPIQLNRGFTNLSLYQLSPKSKEGAQAASIAIEAFKTYMGMPVTPAQKQKARDYLLQTFVDAQKYAEAVEYFKPQIEKTPPDLEALAILGNIARNVGKVAEARHWLEERIKAEPNNSAGYQSLANMDFEELCADSSCRSTDLVKPPPQMPPEQRIKVATHGLGLLKKASELSPQDPNPLVFSGMLLRERTNACVAPPDPPAPKKGPKPKPLTKDEKDAKINDCKRPDLEEAGKLRDKAMAMMKAAGVAPASKDAKATPEKK